MGDDLVYAGKVDHGFNKSSTAEPQARLKPADPQEPALRQEDRPSRHLGRAVAAGGD
jgi:hypothetical protein